MSCGEWCFFKELLGRCLQRKGLRLLISFMSIEIRSSIVNLSVDDVSEVNIRKIIKYISYNGYFILEITRANTIILFLFLF